MSPAPPPNIKTCVVISTKYIILHYIINKGIYSLHLTDTQGAISKQLPYIACCISDLHDAGLHICMQPFNLSVLKVQFPVDL